MVREFNSTTDTQVHLLTIRKALASRNAAVMVGAGFSRNAEGGENLATWRQLSDALEAELRPGQQTGNFSPSGTAQLAEQYARVFSPTHLEQLIKRCVPDDQIMPGQLHKELLELPWSEIFTTNYDTLLERSAERMLDSSYFTVCSREDIPQSKVLGRRRIVKLHGSFPSHRPFILTEEEYRTYPERFAPFVNLVRQSLLENVFCLIGFSGDDPNFLHWLGWVRDMLNRHALPVYLFLTKDPTLGERKLYESRGVVPVVLPISESFEENDYKARYTTLFNELKKPLADSPFDWGDCKNKRPNSIGEKGDSDFTEILDFLPKICAYRKTYPGWLVAPSDIRHRFRSTSRWLEQTLHEQWVKTRLEAQSSFVILTILELYFWAQQIVLGPISDDLAAIGKKALLSNNILSLESLSEATQQFLRKMGMADANSMQKVRTTASLKLLTWARQSHRTADYNYFKNELQKLSHKDPTINDRLIYEDILKYLQTANYLAAIKTLSNWIPKSSDAYTQVLRASLMAECGKQNAALPICEAAIQQFRRQQRSRPGDPELISKEAWACIVAWQIQAAMNHSNFFNFSSNENNTNNARNLDTIEDFDARINVLGTRGYSARGEIRSAIAKLNAEAEPPSPEIQRSVGFNIGSFPTSRIIGQSAEVTDKITASFEWLELIEYVGLLPHTNNVTFYSDQMLQAAWWARFADRPERSIGLLLRANRGEALKPQIESQPRHKTGWLSRYEVAQFPEKNAIELCEELIQQITHEFEGTDQATIATRRATFLIEVLGRLAIRVTDASILLSWANKLVELHSTASFRISPSVWQITSITIGQVCEALPDSSRLPLLLNTFSISPPPDNTSARKFSAREITEWLNPITITRSCSPQSTEIFSSSWRKIIYDLIDELKLQKNLDYTQATWNRLNTIRNLGLMIEQEKFQVRDLIWNTTNKGNWPIIPDMMAVGTLYWPTPNLDADSQLLEILLANPIRPFSSGHIQLSTKKSGRIYFLGNTLSTIGQISFLVDRAPMKLYLIKKIVSAIEEWVTYEAHQIVVDMDHLEINSAVAEIIEYIDEILAQCVEKIHILRKNKATAATINQIIAVEEKIQPISSNGYSLSITLMKLGYKESPEIDTLTSKVVRLLNSSDTQAMTLGFRAALFLIQQEINELQNTARTVFNAVLACIYSLNPNILPHALSTLARLPKNTWGRHINPENIELIDAAICNLTIHLNYNNRPHQSQIPEEFIPTIRFYTFRLSHSLIEIAGAKSHTASTLLASADNDPLPEIRNRSFIINTA